MTDTITLVTPVMLMLVPVVVGVTELVKRAGFFSAKLHPLVSLVLGVASAFLMPAETVQMTIIGGVVVGLMASGLYSATKTTFAQ